MSGKGAGKGAGKPPPATNREALLDVQARRLLATLGRGIEGLEQAATVFNGLANRLERLEPGSPTAAHARASVVDLLELAHDFAGERGE